MFASQQQYFLAAEETGLTDAAEETNPQTVTAFKSVVTTFITYTLVDISLMVCAFYQAYGLQQRFIVAPTINVSVHVTMWSIIGCLFAVDSALQGRLVWMAWHRLSKTRRDIAQAAKISFKMHFVSIAVMFLYQFSVALCTDEWKMAVPLVLAVTAVRLTKLCTLKKFCTSMEAAARRGGTYEELRERWTVKPCWAEAERRGKRTLLILLVCVVLAKCVLIATRHHPLQTQDSMAVTTSLNPGWAVVDMAASNSSAGGAVIFPRTTMLESSSDRCLRDSGSGAGGGCAIGGALTEWGGPFTAPIGCAVGALGGWLVGC